MKNLFFLAAFLLVSSLSFAQVSVKGYYRSNGTYVKPHQRTYPNHTVNDNYSTIGNVNPYTGVAGTHPRDGYTAQKTYSVPSRTYNSSYSTPSYSKPIRTTYSSSYSSPSYSSRTVYTGPRGGSYYINSSGNKTYYRR